MNEQKICFITCVNDMEVYEECLMYLNSLEIPDGYQVENIYIEDANCITKAYNEAMKASDAKYKVYLHQDVFIINKNFIHDILSVFQKNDKIGMLGVIGAKTVPTSGIWRESNQKYGKTYAYQNEEMGMLSLNSIEKDFEYVKAIDGLIMVTQYDLPWREDIFDGWDFYDVSQGAEFLKRGYQIAIPKQNEPWCVHDVEIKKNVYKSVKYSTRFVKEYVNILFPLVSILIPAYNRPDFLEIGLKSIIAQTYPNIEIIICDDSTNDRVQEMLRPYLNKYKNIKYYNNGGPLGGNGLLNAEKCFNLASGEYINYLLDDDVFHPDKIATMLNYFIENHNVSLVTSYRQRIDELGNYLSDIPATTKIFEETRVVNGAVLGKLMLKNLLNVVGELSTVLFKKNDIEHICTYQGRQHRSSGDMAMWFELLMKGDAVYITDTLSYFRIHKDQNTHRMQLFGLVDAFYLIKDSYKNKVFIDDIIEYKECLLTWLKVTVFSIKLPSEIEYEKYSEIINKDLKDELIKQINCAIAIVLGAD
ncbi:glycosyltransferase involved in cell wall biosynthesis [Anaerosolibacter carboniphilus]|uniref:Glycosyltransferase involved in cell wall biosynthesis n=1 Tax=Anaerosolibacter carboniphilus TaxID=1417629 RepID=A0A841KZT1_9FIRM|nr:glycosyltransferase [Anaerosolibacter carboniphilus]MBB6216422.1 glycosyltransferase involved in cell wall biosynthesis [Anaerosolibacter carboniphilus]